MDEKKKLMGGGDKHSLLASRDESKIMSSPDTLLGRGAETTCDIVVNPAFRSIMSLV